MKEEKTIYSQHSIDFVRTAAEVCNYLETTLNYQKSDFIDTSVKLLPLLYLQISMIHVDSSDSDTFSERFVTEEEYNILKNSISSLLGEDDAFLEVFHPDIAYSDTPIAAFISENLADVYQELKDFILNFQIGEEEIMTNSLRECIVAFQEHWGQKVLNSLRALHKLRYSDTFGEMDMPEKFNNREEYRKVERDAFLNFQIEE